MKLHTKSHPLNRIIVTLLLAMSLLPSLLCADISRDVRSAETGPINSDGGFVELGVGLGVSDSPIVGDDNGLYAGITLGGRYQWRGLFIELAEISSTTLSLGYNAWNSDHWSLDILGSNFTNQIIDEDNTELEGLRERESDFLLGSRATGYYGNYIVQLQVGKDIGETHDGTIAQIEAGRSWQLRNWNLHTLFGYRYHSKEVVNYYLGIAEDESSAILPTYRGKVGAYYSAEVGLTYPLTEHWIFRGTAHYLYLDDELSNSPIITNKHSSEMFASFSYVF